MGALAPQFLAKQLTLSQPGVQIMPTTALQLQAPPPPGFSDLATALVLRKMKSAQIQSIAFIWTKYLVLLKKLQMMCFPHNQQKSIGRSGRWFQSAF